MSETKPTYRRQQVIAALRRFFDESASKGQRAIAFGDAMDAADIIESLESQLAEAKRAEDTLAGLTDVIRTAQREHLNVFTDDGDLRLVVKELGWASARLRAENAELREAMQEFVTRCERGEVRSMYTQVKFRRLLAARESTDAE